VIKYLRHSEIDKLRWDEAISAASNGLVYAFTWYLDIVSPGWDALVEDDYISVFPLTWRKKAGIHYLYQPFFTQQLGLFSRNLITPGKIKEFIYAIPEKFRLVEVQLNSENIITEADYFSVFNRRTHHLDLSPSYENISSNYSENIKRNLKKFKRSGLEISSNASITQIVDLFRKNRGKKIETLKKKDFEVFVKLIEHAQMRNCVEIRCIYNESHSLIAGAIFLHSPHSYIFLFSAANAEAKENGSMSALIDNFIRHHDNEIKYLDFEGSMDENLSRFYRSFGSNEVVYLQIRKNNLPPLIRWLKQK
jgi:hypothetical protein